MPTTTEKWPLTGDENILQAKLDRNEGALYARTGIEDGVHVEEVYDIIAELRARLAEAEKREANLLEVLEEARADLEYVTEHQGYENTEAMALTLSRVIAALEGGDGDRD